MKSSGNSALDRACAAIDQMVALHRVTQPELVRLGHRARRIAAQRRCDGRRSKLVDQFYLRQARALEAWAQGFVGRVS